MSKEQEKKYTIADYLEFLRKIGLAPDDPPIANLLARLAKLDGNWHLLSLCSWQATHNDAALSTYGDELNTEDLDLNELFNKFSSYFSESQVKLHKYADKHWLIKFSNPVSLKIPAIDNAIGKPMLANIKNFDNTNFLQKFLTEAQMLIATYNLEHNLHNQLLNGVWIWGGGDIDETIVDSVKNYSLSEAMKKNVKKRSWLSRIWGAL